MYSIWWKQIDPPCTTISWPEKTQACRTIYHKCCYPMWWKLKSYPHPQFELHANFWMGHRRQRLIWYHNIGKYYLVLPHTTSYYLKNMPRRRPTCRRVFRRRSLAGLQISGKQTRIYTAVKSGCITPKDLANTTFLTAVHNKQHVLNALQHVNNPRLTMKPVARHASG
jgi:hypothetical protein